MDNDTRDPSQLISLAVHELRTPASVVGGYLRMLLRDVEHPLADRHRKMIEEAERSCARLTAIVAELSDVGKLDSGALQLSRAPLDAFALVEEVASGVHEAEDRGVRLELRGERGGAPIVGDETRLKAAFTAIFRAILREQPTEVTIVAERRSAIAADRSSAVVVIAPEADVQRAYDSRPAPFDDSRGGLGLALALARRVIEGHGGRLWAPEGGDGRGAALVSLPLTESRT
jgi:signal transduction histidine kinase